MAQEPKLQDQIDELAGMPSDRPTPVEIHFDASMRPKKRESFWAKVAAVVVALGAIAEAIREAIK